MIRIVILIFIFIFIILYFFYRKNEHFVNYKNIDYSNNLTQSDIKNLHMGQLIMTEMFKEFDLLCRKNNIKYWCIGGTLIGALRHKGWVPWDGDIDLGMLNSDYDKFKKISHKLPSNIEFSEPKDKPCSKLRSKNAKYIYTKWGNNWDTNKGVQIDIFIFKKKGINIEGTSAVCGIPDKNKRDYNDIFPLKEIKFENLNVYIPNKYEKISKELWEAHPPKMLPITKRFPHEGNIQIIEKFELNKSNDKIFKDILSFEEKNIINKLLVVLIKHLEERNINYFFAFGSLIGTVRHGFRMPWDDDIDLIISDENVNNILSGLKEIKKGEYNLNDEVLITYKNWGIPIKIKYKNKSYPFIDINTYKNKGKYIVVNKNQLLYGHIKSFKELETDIYPLKKAKFENITVNIPNNYKKILKNQYGKDVFNICKITYNHKPYCKDKDCENENASNHIHTEIHIKNIDKKYFRPKIFN